MFLFFKARFLYNLIQFFLALLILKRFLIYLATRDLAWSFFIFWSMSFHLLKYLFLISSFLFNKFINIFFNKSSRFSFLFNWEYILQFLIMILTLEFLASLLAFCFHRSITFLNILSLKLSWTSKAFFNLLLNAVCLILSKHSFKVLNLCFFKSSLNCLKTFLFFSERILLKTYSLPNFAFINFKSPLFIFILLLSSFFSLHFCKISRQKP